MDRASREQYHIALDADPTDLTDEIAMLRQRLDLLIKAEPTNLELLSRSIGQLARLAATHYHMSDNATERLTDAMHNVLVDIERTLGPEGAD